MGGTRQRLDISVPQVLGSALAAVTAAVVASFVGVAGTVVGAAVVSVVATVGTAAYTHSLNRAKERMRTVQAAQGRVRAGGAGGSTTAAPAVSRTPGLATWAVAGAAVLVFLLSMGAVSAFELVAGRPLSSLLGRHHDRSGTSVSRVFGGGGAAKKVPSKQRSAKPSTELSARPSPGAGVSPSAGPSVGAVPSPAPAPSPSGPVKPSHSPAPAPPAPSPS